MLNKTKVTIKIPEKGGEDIMAYIKKGTSEAVDNAKRKLNAIAQIDASKGKTIDYGDENNPLTTAVLTAKLEEYDAAMIKYNDAMNDVTAAQNNVKSIEDELGEYSKRILKSAAGKFTEESDEYEMLGGTRPSERKKRSTKSAAPAQ